MRFSKLILLVSLLIITLKNSVYCQTISSLKSSFVSPPDNAKPRVYWWWLFNRVDKEGITRDLEEFKSKGISGVNLICTGGYAGKSPLPGVVYQSPEWWDLFRHAVKEAKRNNIEFGFNLSAGGWTMQGPWVNKDNAMKKVVSSELTLYGPVHFKAKLPQPEIVDSYYHDICIQAFRIQDDKKIIESNSMIDLTSLLQPDGQLNWEVPPGKWVILRNGYTLTGHFWSKWFAYPGPEQADTFLGGEGYEIDYLSKAALEDHFDHLGKPILEEVKKVGGKLAYLWSDSWECGKLTWTQDFPNQFYRFRGYDLTTYLPILAGYTVNNSDVSTRFQEDFDRTIQDCIAENFYGYFKELCHKNGVKVGNEAGGPNDIPPIDALKNLGNCDIPSGEFWVNGHRKAVETGYNTDKMQRLNLKQTATAAHIYGKREAMAEAFTMMDGDATHWALGPADLKPYANDAFCEGINRLMLHQSTCQPPSDGKPGYEFCAGQHFTPNLTWWEQSPAFFSYLSRCQFMLQQGKFVADVCFYLGEQAPTLAPPKYMVPTLGPGYDCDYSNSDVLLHRMSVKNGRIVLPDGMSYRLLVLQNCISPSQEICDKVGAYQRLKISSVPSTSMSLEVLKKIRELIFAGATVLGSPPEKTFGLKNYSESDEQMKVIINEIWGDLDGKTKIERKFGKGRIIWGKTAREILLADGVKPDFTFPKQEKDFEQFDYIHRTIGGDIDIFFVINRTNQLMSKELTFRVSGQIPEIWNAVTGEIFLPKTYSKQKNAISIQMEMDKFSSYFFVFRKTTSTDAYHPLKVNFNESKQAIELNGSWDVSFDPKWGGPEKVTFPELISWTSMQEDGIKYYSGKATYKKTFDVNFPYHKNVKLMSEKERLFLDFGEIKDVAEVRLNGVKLGILWCYPWRVEITNAVKSKANQLEIDVINLWANRVIGDLNQPIDKRFTKTHDGFRFDFLAPKTPLIKSGLIGPVKVYSISH